MGLWDEKVRSAIQMMYEDSLPILQQEHALRLPESVHKLYAQSIALMERHEIPAGYLRIRAWADQITMGWDGSAWVQRPEFAYTTEPRLSQKPWPLSWVEWPTPDEAQEKISIAETQSVLLYAQPREHDFQWQGANLPQLCSRCEAADPPYATSEVWMPGQRIDQSILRRSCPNDAIVPYTEWVIKSLGLPL